MTRTQPDAVRLVLPLPPTANHYWTPVIRKRRAVLTMSGEGRKYKAHAHLIIAAQQPPMLSGEVWVRGTIFFARRGCDVDNRIKPTLDSLKGVVYADDVQIGRVGPFDRGLDPKNPRVELVITPLPPAPEPKQEKAA